MAIYKEDIISIDLETGNIHRSFLNRTIGMTDSAADHFGVRVFRGNAAVDLTDVSVQGYFHDPQGNNIAITDGNIVSGNVAVVVLPQACYNYDGRFCLAIKLVGGGVTGTMRIVDGMVDNTNTGGAVAPTGTVPTYQEILALYDEMVDATAAATNAIAPTYSDNRTYEEGEYCVHDGELERCIVEITTPEAWTADHWTAAKFGPDVSSLRATVDQNRSIALSASARAEEAYSKAVMEATKADEATENANNAVSAAGTANENASNAVTEAGNAVQTANSAATTAGNASITANAAQTAANNATAIKPNISLSYDPTFGTYAVGDYVFDGNVFKKCIIAVETPEAFDSTKWEQTTVSEELVLVNELIRQGIDPEEMKEEIASIVNAWLDAHPEATTSVPDYSLVLNKINRSQMVVVTPEMFGAVGDGATDDSEAIQDAIDYLAANHGGTIYFCAKKYRATGLMIESNNITLRGSKSNSGGSGTVIQPPALAETATLTISTDTGMLIGGGIENIAFMGGGGRQEYGNAINTHCIVILNRAEFNFINVYISEYKKCAIYAKDWWDSTIIGLEIRACGAPSGDAALYLGSDNDSCNSLHFFGLHIEECPYQMKLDGIGSHCQFVASKFEDGAAHLEHVANNSCAIYIYEGWYSSVFEACFFSLGYFEIGIDVHNNMSSFMNCMFATSSGAKTTIRNYSGNSAYGKGIVIEGCVFDAFRGTDGYDPIKLTSNAIFSNNQINYSQATPPIKFTGAKNVVTGNKFMGSDSRTLPAIDFESGDNIVSGNSYDLPVAFGNTVPRPPDNIKSNYEIVTSAPTVDFRKGAVIVNYIVNGYITLAPANFLYAPANAEITIVSNNANGVALDKTLFIDGKLKLIPYKKSATLKYQPQLDKWLIESNYMNSAVDGQVRVYYDQEMAYINQKLAINGDLGTWTLSQFKPLVSLFIPVVGFDANNIQTTYGMAVIDTLGVITITMKKPAVYTAINVSFPYDYVES